MASPSKDVPKLNVEDAVDLMSTERMSGIGSSCDVGGGEEGEALELSQLDNKELCAFFFVFVSSTVCDLTKLAKGFSPLTSSSSSVSETSPPCFLFCAWLAGV